MAKSLRASSKVKARNARRYNPNTDYAVTQAARLHAISQRLQARVKGPSVTEETRQSSEDNEDNEKQGQDLNADGESKGWCFCFDCKGGERQAERKGAFIEIEVVMAALERESILAIDVQLLGLVDAETIGLSDGEMPESASPFNWMFRG